MSVWYQSTHMMVALCCCYDYDINVWLKYCMVCCAVGVIECICNTCLTDQSTHKMRINSIFLYTLLIWFQHQNTWCRKSAYWSQARTNKEVSGKKKTWNAERNGQRKGTKKNQYGSKTHGKTQNGKIGICDQFRLIILKPIVCMEDVKVQYLSQEIWNQFCLAKTE